MTPKTNGGRFATIIYATVGIPLTFLYLSTIGNYLASVFRIFYFRVCCRCAVGCRNLPTTVRSLTGSLQASVQRPTPQNPVKLQMVERVSSGRRQVSTVAPSKTGTDRTPLLLTKSTSDRSLRQVPSRLTDEKSPLEISEPTTSGRHRHASVRLPRVLSKLRCCSQLHGETMTSSIETNQREVQRRPERLTTTTVNSSAVTRAPCFAIFAAIKHRRNLTRFDPAESSRAADIVSETNRKHVAAAPAASSETVAQGGRKTTAAAAAAANYVDAEADGPINRTKRWPKTDAEATVAKFNRSRESFMASSPSINDRSLVELMGVSAFRLPGGSDSSTTANRRDGTFSDNSNEGDASCSPEIRQVPTRHPLTFSVAAGKAGTGPQTDDRLTEAWDMAGCNRICDNRSVETPDGHAQKSPSSDVLGRAAFATAGDGADAQDADDDKSEAGVSCQAAMKRCGTAATQVGSALKRMTERRRRRQGTHLQESLKVNPGTTPLRWASSPIGRVRKVGTTAVRWVTFVKARVSRTDSFQTAAARPPTETDVTTACSAGHSAATNTSNCATCVAGTRTDDCDEDGAVADNEDEVTGVTSPSSVIVRMVRSNASAESFVTAYGSLEWLPSDVKCEEVPRDTACDLTTHEEEGCDDDDNYDDLFVDGVSINGYAPFIAEAQRRPIHGGCAIGLTTQQLVERRKVSPVDDRRLQVDASTDEFNRVPNSPPLSASGRRRRRRGQRHDTHTHLATDEQRVPLYVCLIVIAAHICAGSLLFTLWEDWDLLTSFYFCFITLTTIGFGDVVPGTSADDWSSHEKLVLCALWLAFGLSLIAMCCNLVQEEVREKCLRAARRCGLVKPINDV